MCWISRYSMIDLALCLFFSSRRRHTRCALVTGVQTCALPISADMPVQINPHARPVEASRNLLYMRRFTRAVQALEHDASVTRKPRQNRQGRVLVEAVGRIHFGNEIGRAHV